MKKQMKKFLLCAILLLMAVGAKAQSSHRNNWYRNEFFMAPAYFFDGTFAVGYQHNFSTFALSLMPSITLQSQYGNYDNDAEGYGLEAIGKVFFFKMPRAAQLYVGPYLGYRYLNEKWVSKTLPVPDTSVYSSSELETHYNVLNAGILFGVHFMWGRFTLDLNAGGGVRYPSVNGLRTRTDCTAPVEEDFGEIGYKGIVPKGNFTLGIAF